MSDPQQPRRIRVSFACNDERNGMFTGRAWMAQPESLYRVGRHPWDAELVHDDWGRGVALTVDNARMRLRVHRVWFGFKAHRPMFGNWCWDAFEFERGTGKRLLSLMRDNGDWHCEAGSSTFYRWWNSGHLRRLCNTSEGDPIPAPRCENTMELF